MEILEMIQKISSSFYIPAISILDIFEIATIAWLLYKILGSLKNTRAIIVIKGLLALFGVYYVSYLLNFRVIMLLFQWILTILLFAIIVVFQKEIRKLLENLGTKMHNRTSLKDLFKKTVPAELKRFSDTTIEELANACYDMSKVKTGALIVIEGKIPLEEFSESGLKIDAKITSALIKNIFEKNTPLHDGAVIIKNDKIDAATCYLPLTENPRINKNFGTRHRAAIGISEVTDALIIVVSEETGAVSYIEGGTIKHAVPKEQLVSKLRGFQLKDENKLGKNKTSPFHTIKRNGKFKILASIFGFILWVFAMNTLNPISTTTISNVPISIINEDVLDSTGKTINMSEDSYVSVKVTDVRSNIDKIKKEDIVVIGDLSKLSYVYSIPLTASSDKFSNATIEIIGDDNLKVDLEDKVVKEFPIEIIKKNAEKNDFYIDCNFKEKDIVVVSSAKSIANTLDRVTIEIDCSKITNSTSELEIVPTIYDKNGNRVKNILLDLNMEIVPVKLNHLPKKEVPLNVIIKNTSNTSEISTSPKYITIAGEENVLKNVKEIKIDIDMLGLSTTQTNGEYVKNIEIEEYLPRGVVLASEEKVVSINIAQKETNTKSFTFNKNEVEIKNLNSSLITEIKEDVFEIKLSGKSEFLNNVTKADIKPYIDLKDIGSGEYNLPLQINKIENVIMEEGITSNILVKKGE